MWQNRKKGKSRGRAKQKTMGKSGGRAEGQTIGKPSGRTDGKARGKSSGRGKGKPRGKERGKTWSKDRGKVKVKDKGKDKLWGEGGKSKAGCKINGKSKSKERCNKGQTKFKANVRPRQAKETRQEAYRRHSAVEDERQVRK